MVLSSQKNLYSAKLQQARFNATLVSLRVLSLSNFASEYLQPLFLETVYKVPTLSEAYF